MKLLVISLIAGWVLAKLIKWAIDTAKDKKINYRRVFDDGGMPSAHTAAVVSLTTAIFIETGFSYLFIICIVFSLIVMNDAQSVRLITTNQSKIINKLIKGREIKPVQERVGHTPLEVFAGMMIGIAAPLFIHLVFS